MPENQFLSELRFLSVYSILATLKANGLMTDAEVLAARASALKAYSPKLSRLIVCNNLT